MDMSFLLDPPLLIASGILIVHLRRKFNMELKWLSTLVILLFWIFALALYLDFLHIPLPDTAGKGNYFMWNSGLNLLGIELVSITKPTYQNPFGSLNILAIIQFLLYPLWLNLGFKIGSKV